MTTPENIKLSQFWIKRSKDTWKEAEKFTELEYYNTAVNRTYYACFYAAMSLLFSINIKVKTHSGIRSMFGLHFVHTGKFPKDLAKFFTDLYEERQSGDYEDYYEFGKEITVDFIIPAKEFIETIEKLL